MDKLPRCIYKRDGNEYSIKSIDFSHGKVNLNGADIVNIEDIALLPIFNHSDSLLQSIREVIRLECERAIDRDKVADNSYGQVNNEESTLTLFDMSLLSKISVFPVLFLEMEKDKKYTVKYQNEVLGVFHWEDLSNDSVFSHTGYFTPVQPLEYVTIDINLEGRPVQPLEYVTIDINLEGGEENYDGEIRS
jgi:hypothetical protein